MKPRPVITRDEARKKVRYFIIHPNLFYKFVGGKAFSFSMGRPDWMVQNTVTLHQLVSEYKEFASFEEMKKVNPNMVFP